MNSFNFPETCKYQAASAVSKTRKLPDGQFEAVAALFFEGKRWRQVHVIAATRARAKTAALKQL